MTSQSRSGGLAAPARVDLPGDLSTFDPAARGRARTHTRAAGPPKKQQPQANPPATPRPEPSRARGGPAANEVDDRLRGSTGREHLGDPEALELGDVLSGNGPPNGDEHVIDSLLVQ